MGRKIDLTGQRFGRLIAEAPTEKRQNGRVIWRCRCDCGNITYVNANALRTGNTKSCGCLFTKDLTGQRFGRLIAEAPADKRSGGKIVWRCRCDCGNITYVNTTALRRGNTKSCGCLFTKDLTGQRFGRLIAEAPTDKRSRGNIVWRCRCDCGNITYVNTNALRRGSTKSCGCLFEELRPEITAKGLLVQWAGVPVSALPPELIAAQTLRIKINQKLKQEGETRDAKH